MLKIAPLFSGSSGNCIYVKSGNSALLVDAGASCTAIAKALASIGEDIDSVRGIVVTHEHSDHIKGIDVIMRKYGVPVYANAGTMQMVRSKLKLPEMKYMKTIDLSDFYIGDINVTPFKTSHDAVNPFGYAFSCGEKKVAVMTDTGRVTHAMFETVRGSSIVLLESNHDITMLEEGSYPLRLKRRILSAKGHLSNMAAAVTAANLAMTGTKGIILGHLSENNNTEQLAYDTVSGYLEEKGIIPGKHIGLKMASRYEPSGIFEAP